MQFYTSGTIYSVSVTYGLCTEEKGYMVENQRIWETTVKICGRWQKVLSKNLEFLFSLVDDTENLG